jgi:2-polyprenyl-3-methyl-5-hydroxy-6-metoxy-1,4-benzoquinol methylase
LLINYFYNEGDIIMYQDLFNYLKDKPSLYTTSTNKFWDDEHISKGMLEAHLNPDIDPASRNHVFIDRSVEWIGRIAYPRKSPKLLDLGCGPGIYAERFTRRVYQVTGIDFSRRSIRYATDSAKGQGLGIEYGTMQDCCLDGTSAYPISSNI